MASQTWLTDDLYEVLGVPQDSTDDTLRQAYRSLVRRHHPDVNAGCPRSERRFKEVGAAYAVLSDRRRRAQYDLARLRTRRPGGTRTAHSRYGTTPSGYPAGGPYDSADGSGADSTDVSAPRSANGADGPTDPPTSAPSPGGVAPLGGWGALWWAPAAWSASAWTTAAQAAMDGVFSWSTPSPSED